MEQMYCDNIGVAGNSKYTVAFVFGTSGQMGPHTIMLMPPAVMKSGIIMARQMLREYEEKNGTIMLTEEEYKTLGMAPEDW